MLTSANYLVWGMDDREVWVIPHNRFRECCETHSLFAKLMDLPYDFFNGPISAIEDGTYLNGGCFDDFH